MDPVLQTFQQQGSGSAEGQGFGNFFVQGRQLNLSSQHLALAKQAEARAQREQDALLPLQKQLLQYKAINDGLQLGKIVTDADVLTEMNSGIPKVNDLLARFMRSKDGFNDTALLEEYNQQFAQKPWLFSAGNGAKITQGIEAVRAQRTMWISALEHEQDLKDRGLYLQEFVSGSGLSRSELRLGLRDDDLKRQRIANEITRLNNEAVRLQQSGDRNGLANVRLRIQALEQGVELGGMPEPAFGATPAGFTAAPVSPEQVPVSPSPPGQPGFEPMAPLMTDPTIGASSVSTNQPITFRQVERPLTAGAVGQLQKTSVGVDQALGALNRVSKVIQDVPEAFGLKGIGREMYETATGQLNPEAQAKISRAREEAGLAFVQIAPMIRADTGPMNRYEETQVRNLGDTRDWKDYPERAAQKIDSIRNMMIAKKLNLSKQLHRPVDDSLLRVIPPTEVPGLVSSGLLSEEAATRWYDLRNASKAK